MRLLLLVIAVAIAVTLVATTNFRCGGIETNRQRALRAKYMTEMRIILVSLKSYEEKFGNLPSSLGDLKVRDLALENVDIAVYEYHSATVQIGGNRGIVVTAPDPWNKGQVLAGTLGGEVLAIPFAK